MNLYPNHNLLLKFLRTNFIKSKLFIILSVWLFLYNRIPYNKSIIFILLIECCLRSPEGDEGLEAGGSSKQVREIYAFIYYLLWCGSYFFGTNFNFSCFLFLLNQRGRRKSHYKYPPRNHPWILCWEEKKTNNFKGVFFIQNVPYITANICCKSRNLPNTDY